MLPDSVREASTWACAAFLIWFAAVVLIGLVKHAQRERAKRIYAEENPETREDGATSDSASDKAKDERPSVTP